MLISKKYNHRFSFSVGALISSSISSTPVQLSAPQYRKNNFDNHYINNMYIMNKNNFTYYNSNYTEKYFSTNENTYKKYTEHNNYYDGSNNHNHDSTTYFSSIISTLIAFGISISMTALSEEEQQQKTLPTYTMAEVKKHKTLETGIWVTYQGSVYDISNFVQAHPGGMSKIMMAAGGSIEPFWNLYAVHKKNKEVAGILKEMKIGTLEITDNDEIIDFSDPYAKDPNRHPALIPASNKPFNAEPPAELLIEQRVTPNELFFVRNHLPVPVIDDIDNFKLEIEIEGLDKKILHLSLSDLKTKFKQYEVESAIQCAGNRRNELNKIKKVKGLDWNTCAISNAKWIGVRLRDILMYAGLKDAELIEKLGIEHIHFEGLDKDISNKSYSASIHVKKAMDIYGDCIIAYSMNGEPIPPDHGYPLRAIVPGVVGARNVKWLGKIKASKNENDGFWQKSDYKGFSPNVDWDNVDFDSAPAIEDLPIQSSIMVPKSGDKFDISQEDELTVKGYAYSGGGRNIVRVDVSFDGVRYRN